MNIDGVISLADSKDVALVISLGFNFVLVWWLGRVYRDKEKQNDRMTKILEMAWPFAMSKRNDLDWKYLDKN